MLVKSAKVECRGTHTKSDSSIIRAFMDDLVVKNNHSAKMQMDSIGLAEAYCMGLDELQAHLWC